jgi:aryl-alcohol dehydrogenase-like predicted oxidoreductase
METTPLATVALGSTGLEITRIGFGAWALAGGGWLASCGQQDDDESIAAIGHALELGINWIDTAAFYGFGHSEEVVGRAIAGSSRRPYVFTKCALLEETEPVPGVVSSLKRDSLLREVELSLERLGVDAIDLYQIHWPRPEHELEEGWSTMVELKEQGLVRHIGVSNFNVEQVLRVAAIAPVETLQPQYSLIAREAETEILPFCQREGIGVIVYSPMGSGMLTGTMTRERIANLPEDDWRRQAVGRVDAGSGPAFGGPELDQQLATADRVSALAGRLGVAPGAVAIAWALRNPAVDGAIVGLRRADQADELMVGATLNLSDEDAAELESS